MKFNTRKTSENKAIIHLQALRGVLVAGQEKEGELATTSLEFEYLHWKSRCEMLIGGDDISNYDLIILGMCFSMFVYIHTSFCFVLIGENLTAQSTGSHRGIGGGIIFKFWRHSYKLSFLFPPATRVPQRACSHIIEQASSLSCSIRTQKITWPIISSHFDLTLGVMFD